MGLLSGLEAVVEGIFSAIGTSALCYLSRSHRLSDLSPDSLRVFFPTTSPFFKLSLTLSLRLLSEKGGRK